MTYRFKKLGKPAFILIILAAITGTVFGFSCSAPSYLGKTKSIVIAYSPFESNALLWIAENQQFFNRNGLNVTLRKYDTGVGSLDGVLNGEVDIASGVSDFAMVGKALHKERIRIIGNIDKTELIYLVARKDAGIENVSDLKGKRIGTTLGTIAHFYLGRFLELHGMSIQDVKLLDVRTPEGWVNAVVNGDIDAIATANPYANSARERLGSKAVVWQAQGGQPLFALIISTEEWITNHHEEVGKLFKCLAQAEDHLIRNPVEAKTIVQKWLNVNLEYIETIWPHNQFSLSLDQSLIIAMEDEARWMIKNNLTNEKTMPNFSDYIYENDLKAVKPESVNIIR